MNKASKTQVGGNHYTKMKIQPLEYSLANGLDAAQHTIIKYVSRFRDKNGIEDLRKARHTLDLLIEFEMRKSGENPDITYFTNISSKEYLSMNQDVLDESTKVVISKLIQDVEDLSNDIERLTNQTNN